MQSDKSQSRKDKPPAWVRGQRSWSRGGICYRPLQSTAGTQLSFSIHAFVVRWCVFTALHGLSVCGLTTCSQGPERAVTAKLERDRAFSTGAWGTKGPQPLTLSSTEAISVCGGSVSSIIYLCDAGTCFLSRVKSFCCRFISSAELRVETRIHTQSRSYNSSAPVLDSLSMD